MYAMIVTGKQNIFSSLAAFSNLLLSLFAVSISSFKWSIINPYSIFLIYSIIIILNAIDSLSIAFWGHFKFLWSGNLANHTHLTHPHNQD